MKIAGLRLATAGAAAAALVTMTACSSGLGGASASSSAAGAAERAAAARSRSSTDNADATVKAAQAVVGAFEKANPGVTVKTETRPGGTEGDNLVKTKLSTGDMDDVFWYNSGSLLQALNPAQTLVDLDGRPGRCRTSTHRSCRRHARTARCTACP